MNLITLEQPVFQKIMKDLQFTQIDDFIVRATHSLLNERKRKIKQNILIFQDRYKINTAEELNKKIENSEIAEHPTWEDLILMENLENTLKNIDDDIRNLQPIIENSLRKLH